MAFTLAALNCRKHTDSTGSQTQSYAVEPACQRIKDAQLLLQLGGQTYSRNVR